MKLIISISFLLLFAGQGNAVNTLEKAPGLQSFCTSENVALNAELISGSGILDENDPNDFNGPDLFTPGQAPVVNRIQYKTTVVFVVLPRLFSVSFGFISTDLPPPSLS